MATNSTFCYIDLKMYVHMHSIHMHKGIKKEDSSQVCQVFLGYTGDRSKWLPNIKYYLTVT